VRERQRERARERERVREREREKEKEQEQERESHQQNLGEAVGGFGVVVGEACLIALPHCVKHRLIATF